MIDAVLVTCEHGGNLVPPAYRRHFRGARAREALSSHRGSDLGALPLARDLARRLEAPLIASRVSRLVVDLNRSIDSPGLFSEFLAGLEPEQKSEVVRRHYQPYRNRVERTLAAMTAPAPAPARERAALHLSVHTFTPVLNGKARRADAGVLYDPKRARERHLALALREELKTGASGLASACARPPLRVWLNYPYRGYTDGLTTTLRRRFPARRYFGIELEVLDSLLAPTRPERRATIRAVGEAVEAVLDTLAR